jgi:multiple sugar transport system permease protein
MSRRRRRLIVGLIAPAVVVLTFFFVVPSIYNLRLGFLDLDLAGLAQGGRFVGLANYAALVQDTHARLALKNTALWLTLVTVVARLIIGMVIALLLNSAALRRWHLLGFARALVLIPWATPPVVAIATWKWMLDQQYGIVNHLLVAAGLTASPIAFFAMTSTVWLAVDAIIVWREVPFVVLSFLAGLQSISHEYYDAARVDGAGDLAAFHYITLPLLTPIIAVVGLVTTIWTFNNFVYVWLSTRGGPGYFTTVLGTQVYLEAFTNYRLGYSAALGMAMTGILVLFGIVYFRAVFRRTVAAP